MAKVRMVLAFIVALVVAGNVVGPVAAAEAEIDGTTVVFGDAWRKSTIPPMQASDHLVLKATSQAVILSVAGEELPIAERAVASLAIFAPHVTAESVTVTDSDDATWETGTFTNSGETYAYLALAPTAEVPFTQVVTAPADELAAALAAAQAEITIADSPAFGAVDPAIVGGGSATPAAEATPAG